jgi:hypothetical protein
MSAKDLELSLEDIVSSIDIDTMQSLASRNIHVRKRTMQSLIEAVPSDLKAEISQVMPIQLLENNNSYDSVLASLWWATTLVWSGVIDDEVTERVYESVMINYLHDKNSDDEEIRSQSEDLKERVKLLVDWLLEKRPIDSENRTAIYIDIFNARFQLDFNNDIPLAVRMFESLEQREVEDIVIQLWSLYESTHKYEKAHFIYHKWFGITNDTKYLIKTISLMYKEWKKKESYELYLHYAKIASTHGVVIPYIYMKLSIDNDSDLQKLMHVGFDLLMNGNLTPDSIVLFLSAREYIDRELRNLHENMSEKFYYPEDDEFPDGLSAGFYALYRENRETIDHPFDDTFLEVRQLFLLAINAIVLFDNSTLRNFDVFCEEGDAVNSGDKIFPPIEGASLPEILAEEYIPNHWKVIEFIHLLWTHYQSERGLEILASFFGKYPFDWIERSIQILDKLYRDDDTIWDSEEWEENKEEAADATDIDNNEPQPPDTVNPIIVSWVVDSNGNIQKQVAPSSKDLDADKKKIADSIFHFLEYLNRRMIGPDDLGILQAINELGEDVMFYEWDGSMESLNEMLKRDWDTIKLFNISVKNMWPEYVAEYEKVKKVIVDSYSPAVLQYLYSLAIEPVQIKEKIPDFISNDYYLAWYLLMSHLLGHPVLQDKFIQDMLQLDVLRLSDFEESDLFGWILCSTLASAWYYGPMCEYIMRHDHWLSDPTFLSLFLLWLTYLEKADREYFFENLDTEILQVYQVESLEELMEKVEESIEPDEQYAWDDKAKLALSRMYLLYAQEKSELIPLDESIRSIYSQDGVVNETKTEAEFFSLRIELENSDNHNKDKLAQLFMLFKELSYEHASECACLLMRISYTAGIMDIFYDTHRISREKMLSIGIWEIVPDLLSQDEYIVRKWMFELSKSNLSFLPTEIKTFIHQKCLTLKYKSFPVDELGDTAFQAAYILSYISPTPAQRIDSIYQYFLWMKHYTDREGVYTDAIMDELSINFEKTFWYNCNNIEADEWNEIDPSERLIYYLQEHLKKFMIEHAKIKDVIPEENIRQIEAVESLWTEALSDYIDIFQRIPNPRVESYIDMLRKKYNLAGDNTISFHTFHKSFTVH